MRHQCGHTTRDTAGDIVFTKSAEPSRPKTRVVRKYNAFFFPEAGGFRETRTKLLTRCELEVQIFLCRNSCCLSLPVRKTTHREAETQQVQRNRQGGAT